MKKEDKELITAILNTGIVIGAVTTAIIKGSQITAQDIFAILNTIKITE